MADETNEDDSWLYGSSNPEDGPTENQNKETNGDGKDPEHALEKDEDEDDADGNNEVCDDTIFLLAFKFC